MLPNSPILLNLLGDSPTTFTVNPVLFLIPLKLQLNICMDTLILFFSAFFLLLTRKRYSAFYTVHPFMVGFVALFVALLVNADIQATMYDLSKASHTNTFSLFWDAFITSSHLVKLKAWFFGGNLFLLAVLYGSFKQNSEKDNLYFTLPLMILLLSSVGSLVLMAANLLTLLLCIETFSFLGLYIIRLNSNKMSAEASLLYFFMNLLSTGFLSLGFLLVYIGTGEYIITDISDYVLAHFNHTEQLRFNSNISFGFGLILGTFLFKMAAFPCFFWMPLTFKAMSFSGVAITSFTIKFVNVCLFLSLSKLVLPAFLSLTSNAWWIFVCALGSIIVGTFLALKEFNFRKFLAFTSINQMGYILLGLLPFANQSFKAFDSVMYFTFIYFLSNLLFFSTLANIRINNIQLNTLSDLRVLYQFNPTNMWLCVLAIFSMAGLPPTAGFWAKYYIIRNCWDASFFVNWDSNFILIFRFALGLIVFLNFFSAIYYIRLVIMLVFNTLNITWSGFIQNTCAVYSSFREYWNVCKNAKLPSFNKGIKFVTIYQFGTIAETLKQIENDYLTIDIAIKIGQFLCASYLIIDFISRLL